MNVLGFEITRKAAVPVNTLPASMTGGGWYPIIREPFAGAWQRNIEAPICDVLAHPTVFACVTLIGGDVAKTRWQLVCERPNDVWEPIERAAFSPVLRKPNGYQIPFQFREQWINSKLISGNTYALKLRDQRGVVVGLYVLDPSRVRVLVAPDGSVFYQLQTSSDASTLASVAEGTIAPAREIIHDRFNCLYHPLIGISPLYAAGVAAMLGQKIQTNSANFYENGAQPGGILTTPKSIHLDTVKRIKEEWSTNYGGVNAGKVAVIGDDLKYQSLAQPAKDSELSEQWKNASEAIAAAFHVPWFMVGGPLPPYNNVQTLGIQYFTQCLQPLMTQYEDALEEGLGLGDRIEGERYGVQFMIPDLLLMDSLTQMQVIKDGVSAGVVAPNEGRARINLPPAPGGGDPYLQQQNYSLAALAKRDLEAPAPSSSVPAPAAAAEPEDDEAELENDEIEAAFGSMVTKGLPA